MLCSHDEDRKSFRMSLRTHRCGGNGYLRSSLVKGKEKQSNCISQGEEKFCVFVSYGEILRVMEKVRKADRGKRSDM